MAEDEKSLEILIYSDDREIRQQVINSVGIKVASDMPEITWDEAATATITQDKVHHHHYDQSKKTG